MLPSGHKWKHKTRDPMDILRGTKKKRSALDMGFVVGPGEGGGGAWREASISEPTPVTHARL